MNGRTGRPVTSPSPSGPWFSVMHSDERQPIPFNEQAAVEELEGVLRELEASRQRRRQANDAFDRFLKSFGRSAPAPPPRAGRGGTVRVPAGEPAPRYSPGLSAPAGPGAAPTFAGEPKAARGTSGAPSWWPGRMPPRGALLALAGVVLALLVVFGALSGDPEVEGPSSSLSSEPAGAPEPVTPAAPEPARAAAPPVTELTTLRHVWVRLIVDGEKVLERELPPGETIPVPARRNIVLRAGDAGAVRLVIKGQDQGLLGQEGRAVTRTFDVTALP